MFLGFLTTMLLCTGHPVISEFEGMIQDTNGGMLRIKARAFSVVVFGNCYHGAEVDTSDVLDESTWRFLKENDIDNADTRDLIYKATLEITQSWDFDSRIGWWRGTPGHWISWYDPGPNAKYRLQEKYLRLWRGDVMMFQMYAPVWAVADFGEDK